MKSYSCLIFCVLSVSCATKPGDTAIESKKDQAPVKEVAKVNEVGVVKPIEKSEVSGEGMKPVGLDLPRGRAAVQTDGFRMPDMLTLPGAAEMKSTTPSGESKPGTVVAKPPVEAKE